jgi:predicted transposase YbfD/YdcC
MSTTSLVDCFSVIRDPRQESKIEHELIDILILCVFGVICGAEGWQDIEEVGRARLDWLQERGFLKNGIPVDDTIARIISSLCPEELQHCFINWMSAVEGATDGKVVAIDGKTLRHSYDKKKRKAAIHMVSAFAAENGVVLGQRKTVDKSNEITAIPALLDLLDVKGCIVTIDAMGCQEKIAEKIIAKEADYVLAVKGNQKQLHEEIVDFFQTARKYDFRNVQYDYFEEAHKGHGRVEQRRYWISDMLTSISNPGRWLSLCSIGMVESEQYIDGKTTSETRYFISSLTADAKIFANAVRKHWAIENHLHWVLDVSFREDESRVRRDNAPENLGVFRHVAMNALRKEKTCKKGVKAKRFKATLQSDYAQKVLSGIF